MASTWRITAQRLSKMPFEVKSMVVNEVLKWFEFGGTPSSAGAGAPGVESLRW